MSLQFKIVTWQIIFIFFRAPLSNNQEVSAYGADGDGDTMDVWTVICSGNNPVCG